MSDVIIVALVSGGLTLLGTIISNLTVHSKTMYRIEQVEERYKDLSDLRDDLEKIKTDVEVIKVSHSNLTQEVRKHNGVVERLFIVEKSLDILDERQRVANHRIDDLERAN